MCGRRVRTGDASRIARGCSRGVSRWSTPYSALIGCVRSSRTISDRGFATRGCSRRRSSERSASNGDSYCTGVFCYIYYHTTYDATRDSGHTSRSTRRGRFSGKGANFILTNLSAGVGSFYKDIGVVIRSVAPCSFMVQRSSYFR